MSDKLSGIDNQKEGGSHYTESKKCYDSVDEAKIYFQLLKDRLLNIEVNRNFLYDKKSK